MDTRLFLRFEGLVVGLGAAAGYFTLVGDPVLFVLLVLLPDVSIAAYLGGARVGSLTYNAVHALALPVVLLAWGLWASHGLATGAGLVWIAHVGADRAMGLGLKYDDAPFRETHLQRV